MHNADEAIHDIRGWHGTDAWVGLAYAVFPKIVLLHLVKKGVKQLTCISNNAGVDDFGIGLIAPNKAGKKNDFFLCGRECRI